MSTQVSAEDIRRFKRGDETVLEKLLGTLGPGLESVLCGKFPALRPYVEDLLAESLYRIWTRRAEFDPDRGTLFNWWAKVAENAAHDLSRSGWQRERSRESPLDAAHAPSANGEVASPSPGDAGPAREAFWQVFGQLPEQDRRILLYYAQTGGQGAWAAALAGELGMSAGAIRVRRMRLVQRLREAMSERGFQVASE